MVKPRTATAAVFVLYSSAKLRHHAKNLVFLLQSQQKTGYQTDTEMWNIVWRDKAN